MLNSYRVSSKGELLIMKMQRSTSLIVLVLFTDLAVTGCLSSTYNSNQGLRHWTPKENSFNLKSPNDSKWRLSYGKLRLRTVDDNDNLDNYDLGGNNGDIGRLRQPRLREALFPMDQNDPWRQIPIRPQGKLILARMRKLASKMKRDQLNE